MVSGTPPIPGRVATEADPLPIDGPVGGRSRAVTAMLELAARGVRTATFRLPRTVHNQGAGGFAGMLTGTAWHAVADPGDAVQEIATVIGARLKLPVQAMPLETYGPLGPIFATDQPASSNHTRDTLGWLPTHPSLLQDLENIQP